MPFESDFKSHLAGDSSIAAEVGERIHPSLLPAGSDKPAITYQKVSVQPAGTLDGGDSSLLQIRVQVDCWARSYDDVQRLAELVRARMKTAAASFRPGAVFSQDVYDEETKLHRVTTDFTVWYRTS